MAILVDKNTVALVQGITGKEGARAAKDMAAYGTRVVAGVTPGKGGMATEEGVPVFNSVKEAKEAFPEINATLITVPSAFAADAALEAMGNNIPLVDVFTEKIPVAFVSRMIRFAQMTGTRLVGPSSVGILSPGKGKIGSIGSGDLAKRVFSEGPVGVISKSGGMTAELSRILTDNGLGQSTAVGIGGDILAGSDFVDIALLFEQDADTKAIVIFGEVGGTYEEQLAGAIQEKKITKPVFAVIAGRFSETLPQETVLGHAGAIVQKGRGSASSKIRTLKDAGAWIADTADQIPALIKEHVSL
ncbi:MAG: succinate--CoA ligase subunit alpha [Candidatus Yanofskybacteria bacterium]|nr:succinate--CoA ligase subunit alpha [Candidatus Yanofskybacteria bacterium]